MTRLGLAALVLCGSASLAGAGGFATPPARVDLATTTASFGAERGTGFHLLAGVHWASLSGDPRTPIDIGVGYVQDQLWLPEARLAAGGAVARKIAPYEDDGRTVIHGGYLEIAPRISGSEHRRAFVGLRFEWLAADVLGEWVRGKGVTARASYEIFAGGADCSGSACLLGNVGLGAFFETGVRTLGDEAGFVSTIGFSVRTPLVIAN